MTGTGKTPTLPPGEWVGLVALLKHCCADERAALDALSRQYHGDAEGAATEERALNMAKLAQAEREKQGALLDKLTDMVRTGRLKIYRDRGIMHDPKEISSRAFHLPMRLVAPGFIGTLATAERPVTVLHEVAPMFRGQDLRAIWPSLFSRPTQDLVNDWVLRQYQRAHDNGQVPPKRDAILHDCRAEFGATDKQGREALSQVPAALKRRRGERDQ